MEKSLLIFTAEGTVRRLVWHGPLAGGASSGPVMYVNGMRQLETELALILKAIAVDRGIDVILNTTRGQGVVIFARPQTLISEEAKKRLDERLPDILLPVPPLAQKSGEIQQLPRKAKE